AQGHVRADDFRGDRHLQVAAIPDCCSGPRPRCLHGPARLAEQVELPARVESRAPGREFLAGKSETATPAATPAGSRRSGYGIFADPLARDGPLRINLGHARSAGHALASPRFANPRRRHFDIKVLGQCSVDEIAQLRIAETAPPD